MDVYHVFENRSGSEFPLCVREEARESKPGFFDSLESWIVLNPKSSLVPDIVDGHQPPAEPVTENPSNSEVNSFSFEPQTEAAASQDPLVHFRVVESRTDVDSLYDEIPEDPAGYLDLTYTQVLRGAPDVPRSRVPAAPTDETLYWGQSASDSTDSYLRFRQSWCKRWGSKLAASVILFVVIIVSVVLGAVFLFTTGSDGLPAMDESLHFSMKANVSSMLFVLGGQGSTTNAHISTEVYNFELASWTSVADLPEYGRREFGAVNLGGRVYAIGGRNSRGIMLATVDVYDPNTNIWNSSSVGKMSIPRTQHAVAVLGSRIYAVGGIDSNGAALASVDVLDTKSNEWKPISPMKKRRKYVAVGALGGYLYAVGGSDGSVQNSVERYDPRSDRWSFVNSLTQKRCGLSVAVVDGKLYAIGGFAVSAKPALSSVEVYDPREDSWSRVADMRFGRFGAAAVALEDGQIYVVGGFNNTAYFDSVEVYNPASNGWKLLSARMQMSREWPGFTTLAHRRNDSHQTLEE